LKDWGDAKDEGKSDFSQAILRHVFDHCEPCSATSMLDEVNVLVTLAAVFATDALTARHQVETLWQET